MFDPHFKCELINVVLYYESAHTKQTLLARSESSAKMCGGQNTNKLAQLTYAKCELINVLYYESAHTKQTLLVRSESSTMMCGGQNTTDLCSFQESVFIMSKDMKCTMNGGKLSCHQS